MLVPMTALDLLNGQRSRLFTIVRRSFGSASGATTHVAAFTARLLGPLTLEALLPSFSFEEPIDRNTARYRGYPRVAYLGFGLAAGGLTSTVAQDAFLLGVRALRQRSADYLAGFVADDIAVLGVADGLAALDDTADLRSWLLPIIDRFQESERWSVRMRLLAGDLLDGRGRLRLQPSASPDALALDCALRAAYPQAFLASPAPTNAERQALLRTLLTELPPPVGELARSAVWLTALEHQVDAACADLVPTIPDAIRLLQNVQAAFKRWPWKERSRRKGTSPTRWLIDDEYDVQALLWTVLYPVYGSDLVDEEYLPSWGNVQPRADLGILKLKLIIEVKIARTPGDFGDIEEQVAGDLGLYFKETARFDRMVVVVYDDCDTPRPERYDALRNALKGRDRIEDVLIIRRPSMIPNRGERGAVVAEASPVDAGNAAGA